MAPYPEAHLPQAPSAYIPSRLSTSSFLCNTFPPNHWTSPFTSVNMKKRGPRSVRCTPTDNKLITQWAKPLPAEFRRVEWTPGSQHTVTRNHASTPAALFRRVVWTPSSSPRAITGLVSPADEHLDFPESKVAAPHQSEVSESFSESFSEDSFEDSFERLKGTLFESPSRSAFKNISEISSESSFEGFGDENNLNEDHIVGEVAMGDAEDEPVYDQVLDVDMEEGEQRLAASQASDVDMAASESTHDQASDLDVDEVDHSMTGELGGKRGPTDPKHDLQRAAQLVFDMLTGNDHGCSKDQHQIMLALHTAQEGDSHHDLSATYGDLPQSRLSKLVETGLCSEGFPGPRGMARKLYTSAHDLKRLFEGRDSPESTIRNICLHEEIAPDTRPIRTFDTDSFMAFPASLGAFSRGFGWCPVRHIGYNINVDLGVTRTISASDKNGVLRNVTLPLRDIPHAYIGYLEGFKHAPVFAFFPGLVDPDQPTNFLTIEQSRRFNDQIMIRAFRTFLPANATQHHPATFATAEAKAAARSKELLTGSRELIKQYAHYSIPNKGLDDMWNEACGLAEDPANNLQEFGGMFLFVNVKGVKLKFQGDESCYRSMKQFHDYIGSYLDIGRSQPLIVDFAAEICPPNPGRNGDCVEAVTYLWKECCLRRQYEYFRRECFDGKLGKPVVYNVGFLRDAACMTLIPPKKSWLRKAGWIKHQCYGCEKEVRDALTTYNFQDERLPELAIDPDVHAANVSAAKAGPSRDRAILVGHWAHNKSRLLTSYTDSEQSSSGSRCEVRMEYDLFMAAMEIARREEATEPPILRLPGAPESVWPVTMRNFSRFLLGNYEKLVSTIEISSITSAQTGITKERSRLMMSLFMCLREFPNSDLARKGALWWDAREGANGVQRGLGMETTIHAHGYGWFVDVVDWQDLRFRPDIAREMVGVNKTLLAWYQGSRLIRDTNEELQMCFARLEQGGLTVGAENKIGLLMAHLLFRQFRYDVLRALKKELRVSGKIMMERDEVKFSYRGIREALVGEPNAVRGNKSKARTPASMTEWLWGTSRNYNRTRFQHKKPYHILYQKVLEATRARPSFQREWQFLFEREFLKYHWVLPYPDPNAGTLISTAKNTQCRNWFSTIEGRKGGTHTWGREVWRGGLPGDYPSTLRMSTEDLAKWLKELI